MATGTAPLRVAAAMPRLPKHPFKTDPKFIKNHADVLGLYQGMEDLSSIAKEFDDLVFPAGIPTAKDLELWYTQGIPKVDEIKQATDVRDRCAMIVRKGTENSIKAAGRIQRSLDRSQSELTDSVVPAPRFEIDIDSEFAHLLREVLEVRGVDVCSSIIETEMEGQHDQQAKLAKIFPSVINACRGAIPGATTITEWTETTLVKLIESTGTYIENLQGRIKELEAAPLPDLNDPGAVHAKPTDSQQLVVAGSFVTPHTRQKDLGGQATRADDVVRTSRPTSKNLAKRPRASTRDTSSSSSQASAVSEPTTIDEELISEESALELEVTKLRVRLANLEVSLENERKENNWSKAMVLRDFEFGPHLDEDWVTAIASQIRQFNRQANPFLDEDVPATLLHSTPALCLADDFDNEPFKPLRPMSSNYLEALVYERGLVPSDRKQLLIRNYESHVMWLNTRLQEISTRGSANDTENLLIFIDGIVGHCVLHGIGRSALFIAIANIKQRNRQDGARLLREIFIHIARGGYGSIYRDWDILMRITMCWMFAQGGKADLTHLKIEARRRELMNEYMFALKTKQPRDFASLLTLQATNTFIRKENSVGIRSWLVIFKGARDQQMVVLRSGSGEVARIDREFIWVVYENKCWFSSCGLELKWEVTEDDTPRLLVRAVALHERPYFLVEDEDALTYIGEFYEGEALKAHDSFLRNNP